MQNLPPANEIVALLVVVALALGLISLLLFIKGIESGHPRRQVRRLVVRLWLGAVVAMIALLALRLVVGDLVSGAPWESGGMTVAPLHPWQIVALVAALAILVFCLALVLRTVRFLSSSPRPPRPGPTSDKANTDKA